MQTKTRTFTATRHASFHSYREDRDETYCLMFKHNEGDPHIEVNFRGKYMHDSINVFDHATETTRVHTWDEFRQEVADYMKTRDRDALRLDWINAHG